MSPAVSWISYIQTLHQAPQSQSERGFRPIGSHGSDFRMRRRASIVAASVVAALTVPFSYHDGETLMPFHPSRPRPPRPCLDRRLLHRLQLLMRRRELRLLQRGAEADDNPLQA